MTPPSSTNSAGDGPSNTALPAEFKLDESPAGAPKPVVQPTAQATSPEPAPSKPSAPRSTRREQAASDALRGWIRDLHERHFGPVAPASGPVRVDLAVTVDPANNWAVSFPDGLTEQILPQLQQLHSRIGVFQPGRVYCFKCESCTCAHASPPNPLSVFAGYDPMGMAEWIELAQALVDARDPQVDLLFARTPGIAARMQYGRDLRVRQLASFGKSSASYGVLAQVIAGYLEPGIAGAPERMALTVQAVETSMPGGSTEVRLNVLAGGMDESHMQAWLAESTALWIARALGRARAAVERINDIARHAADASIRRRALGRMPVILGDLVESLHRGRRQEQRRTRHAEVRRVHDRRPVHKAVEDLNEAPPHMCFADERGGTLVICGSHGRAHVYSPDGRHVTSFTLPPGGMEQRVKSHRWAPAEPSAISNLREAVRRHAISLQELKRSDT